MGTNAHNITKITQKEWQSHNINLISCNLMRNLELAQKRQYCIITLKQLVVMVLVENTLY